MRVTQEVRTDTEVVSGVGTQVGPRVGIDPLPVHLPSLGVGGVTGRGETHRDPRTVGLTLDGIHHLRQLTSDKSRHALLKFLDFGVDTLRHLLL